MKKIFKIQLTIFCLLLFSCSSESNESKQIENKPIVTFQDSLSYTMGVNIGQNLPETEINRDLLIEGCLLYTSPSPRDVSTSRMPSSA